MIIRTPEIMTNNPTSMYDIFFGMYPTNLAAIGAAETPPITKPKTMYQ